MRFLTAGESHGKALVVVVEGMPAGLPFDAEQVAEELARRRLGYGRGPRMRFERDEITLLGGIRHGRTLGSPVAIEIANTEWPKWEEEMSPAAGAPTKPLTAPRPGHAMRCTWCWPAKRFARNMPRLRRMLRSRRRSGPCASWLWNRSLK